jgi:hypothetical protein
MKVERDENRKASELEEKNNAIVMLHYSYDKESLITS